MPSALKPMAASRCWFISALTPSIWMARDSLWSWLKARRIAAGEPLATVDFGKVAAARAGNVVVVVTVVNAAELTVVTPLIGDGSSDDNGGDCKTRISRQPDHRCGTMTLRKDAMEILRVFNNNVVLAKGGDGGEVIPHRPRTGVPGKPGQTVDESKVVRTFVPSDGRDPDHLAQMLADIPPEIIRVVVESMQETGLGARDRQHHAGRWPCRTTWRNAVEQVRRGIGIIYPLLGEVSNLYPQEYAQGVRCSHRSMHGSTSRCRTARPSRLHASGQRRLRHRRPVPIRTR